MKHCKKVDYLLELTRARARIQHVVSAYQEGNREHRGMLIKALDETVDLYHALRHEVRDAKVRR